MTDKRCVICGAGCTAARAFWKPTFCTADDVGPGQISGSEAVIEQRSCEHCGRAFCVRLHRPQRFCSVACRSAAITPSNYRGGLCLTGGRWYVVCRDWSSLAYSRAVMAAEVGRLLREDEIVHHINEDPADDRVENLAIVTRSEHALIHLDALVLARARRRVARRREEAA